MNFVEKANFRAFLKTVPLLKEGISDIDMSILSNKMKIEKYKRKTQIITSGSKGEKFYIIMEAYKKKQSNYIPTVVATLKPKQYFGEMLRNADVLAQTDVVCAVLDAETFLNVLSPNKRIQALLVEGAKEYDMQERAKNWARFERMKVREKRAANLQNKYTKNRGSIRQHQDALKKLFSV